VACNGSYRNTLPHPYISSMPFTTRYYTAAASRARDCSFKTTQAVAKYVSHNTHTHTRTHTHTSLSKQPCDGARALTPQTFYLPRGCSLTSKERPGSSTRITGDVQSSGTGPCAQTCIRWMGFRCPTCLLPETNKTIRLLRWWC